jgi:hypothetical protein
MTGWGLAIAQFVEALLLAVVNSKIVDYVADPVRKKFPDADLWWLIYVSLATGAAVGWFAEINLFREIVPNVILGRVLSSILIGGGASLLHDIFDKEQ